MFLGGAFKQAFIPSLTTAFSVKEDHRMSTIACLTPPQLQRAISPVVSPRDGHVLSFQTRAF